MLMMSHGDLAHQGYFAPESEELHFQGKNLIPFYSFRKTEFKVAIGVSHYCLQLGIFSLLVEGNTSLKLWVDATLANSQALLQHTEKELGIYAYRGAYYHKTLPPSQIYAGTLLYNDHSK
ncbi:hypothetical protein L3556_07120 [Candidatus Synechococcus calcipolaris G9]|uniref:Uncharacterized protein n=1 Tax=Candidatus Synechococcus calcipolaris G9 TaxID=1497997 RepID=A0ABT6EY26_9SYNE|nr:hypothetical protein [Candidatus Synechococcus calcipolaris]MDG2990704.1 hypothetical protein [Candidatus Synechococcus calcipolaris G9]